MQEEKLVNTAATIYRDIVRVLAWVLLFVSWVGLGTATSYFVRAVQSYGLLDARPYLDAGLGYYGLFSFGIASLAVILAVKGGFGLSRGPFRLFKLTLVVSIFFIMPIPFSMIMAMLGSP
jgi:hypothetical protein